MTDQTAGADTDSESDRPSVLDRVRRLNGVTWEWKDPSYVGDDRPRAIGLIAQDVRDVFPEAVRTNSDGYLMVDYAGLVGVLVEAVKELAARVDDLESRATHAEAGESGEMGLPHLDSNQEPSD